MKVSQLRNELKLFNEDDDVNIVLFFDRNISDRYILTDDPDQIKWADVCEIQSVCLNGGVQINVKID